MTEGDISQVSVIDREAFPTMWPPVNFRHELTNRIARYIVAADGTKTDSVADTGATAPVSRHFLGLKLPFFARPGGPAPATPEYVVGYVGTWTMVDETHVINIAVRESHRGRGIGEMLLISTIELAAKQRSRVVTLEVRASNAVAQNLYLKYGFKQVGLRKAYYTDNKEDAFIMTTDVITSADYTQQFHRLKSSHTKRFDSLDYQLPL